MGRSTYTDAPDGPVLAGSGLGILIYIDDSLFKSKWLGIRTIEDVLKKSGATVNVTKASQKITKTLLKDHQEIWFFLIAKDDEDERLEKSEIDLLRAWMDRGGGVLVTGDHADEDVKGAPLVGRGGPVGRRIPRARHMRVWDAPPKSGAGSINSTQFAHVGTKWLVDPERDGTPQPLGLPRIDQNQPHRIFRHQNRFLDRFPDHMHEGNVVLPGSLLDTNVKPDGYEIDAYKNEWCGAKLYPEVIARGYEKTRASTFDLMAAWDGHLVSTRVGSGVCGRIITDSSFHHYVDYNLCGLAGTSYWDDIKRIYINQAIWLAPPEIQAKLRRGAAKEVRRLVESISGLNDRQIGEIALGLFARELPGALFYGLGSDLLREHAPALVGAAPPDFEEVLVGAYMRRFISGEKQAPLLERARVEGKGFVAEAVASYDDEVLAKQASWDAFSKRLLGK